METKLDLSYIQDEIIKINQRINLLPIPKYNFGQLVTAFGFKGIISEIKFIIVENNNTKVVIKNTNYSEIKIAYKIETEQDIPKHYKGSLYVKEEDIKLLIEI